LFCSSLFQFYQSEALFSTCYGSRSESGRIATDPLFKPSAEMLRRPKSASGSDLLDRQLGKLQKLLRNRKPMMPNVFDRRHLQFLFEQLRQGGMAE